MPPKRCASPQPARARRSRTSPASHSSGWRKPRRHIRTVDVHSPSITRSRRVIAAHSAQTSSTSPQQSHTRTIPPSIRELPHAQRKGRAAVSRAGFRPALFICASRWHPQPCCHGSRRCGSKVDAQRTPSVHAAFRCRCRPLVTQGRVAQFFEQPCSFITRSISRPVPVSQTWAA